MICLMYCSLDFFLFFFKQKTAYDMRISDWSSDVCSSDLVADAAQRQFELVAFAGELEHFLLGEPLRVARKLLVERLHALDRLRDRLPVGEHPAQPAMVAEMLPRPARALRDRVQIGSAHV